MPEGTFEPGSGLHIRMGAAGVVRLDISLDLATASRLDCTFVADLLIAAGHYLSGEAGFRPLPEFGES